MNSVAKGMACLATICWLFVAVGALAVALGDGEGINAVVGAGLPGIAFTIGAAYEHHTATTRRTSGTCARDDSKGVDRG